METALCFFRKEKETLKTNRSTVMLSLIDQGDGWPDPTDLTETLFEGLTDEYPYGFERAVATPKDIVEKEFNLAPRLYIKTKSDLEFERYLSEYSHRPLSEIATVIKTQQLTQLTEEDKPNYPDGFASQFRMVLLPSHVDEFGVITFDLDGGAHFAAAVNGLAVNKKSLAVADACSDTILRRGERVRTGASKVRAGTVNR